MPYPTPLALVQAWQEAANHQDIQRLLSLSDPNIAIIGPRGTGYGHQLLRDWLGRAGLTLTPHRTFARSNDVVIAQHALWRSLESGEITGEAEVASWFRVTGRQVTQVARYETLEMALEAAGLTDMDVIGDP